MTRMKDERNKLRIIMSQYMGDDLVLLSLQDVTNLEQKLEFSLYKVRLRKVATKCEQFNHYVPRCVGLVWSLLVLTPVFAANSKSYLTSSCLRCATGYVCRIQFPSISSYNSFISEQLSCDCSVCSKSRQEMRASQDMCLMVRRTSFLHEY
jgi:hypothetical protein